MSCLFSRLLLRTFLLATLLFPLARFGGSSLFLCPFDTFPFARGGFRLCLLCFFRRPQVAHSHDAQLVAQAIRQRICIRRSAKVDVLLARQHQRHQRLLRHHDDDPPLFAALS